MKTRTLIVSWLALLIGTGAGCFGGRHKQELQANSFLEDKVTQARVEAALHRGATNALSDVLVTVTNGTVYLTGVVGSTQEQQSAAQLAQSVHRVQQVQNQIQVRH